MNFRDERVSEGGREEGSVTLNQTIENWENEPDGDFEKSNQGLEAGKLEDLSLTHQGCKGFDRPTTQ